MSRLDVADEARLVEIFAGLTHDVTLHLASDDDDLIELIELVTAPAGGKIRVERLRPGHDAPAIAALGLERTPGIALRSELTRGRVLLYGAPSGYELVTLLAALVDLGGGAEDDELLSRVARHRLDTLSSDVQVTVFASPGCPYSPHMARLAFRFAMASPLVTAVAVEVASFPALAKRHRVNAVPHIDINGAETVIGAVPELELLDAIASAAWRPPAN